MAKGSIKLFCLIVIAAVTAVMIAGCVPEQELSGQISPPFQDTAALTDYFQSRQSSLVPLHASGDGYIEYRNDSGKISREGIIRYDLLFAPADRVYVSADHLLQKRAVRFGSDGSEFWAWIRLPEKNEYFWGDQDLFTNRCRMPFALRPDVIMDAFGVADLRTLIIQEQLEYENGSYVFTLKDIEDNPVKKYYLTHDGKVKAVDYFDADQNKYLVLKLDYYKFFSNYSSIELPAKIDIISLSGDYKIVMQLKNVKPFAASSVKARKIFSRPQPVGTTAIYHLNRDCRFVPQY